MLAGTAQVRGVVGSYKSGEGGGGGGQVGTYICYSTVVRAYVPQHASTFVATGRLGIVR